MRQGSGVLTKSSLDEGRPFRESLARVDDESLRARAHDIRVCTLECKLEEVFSALAALSFL